jgi:outer membrane protein assembly factor BamB
MPGTLLSTFALVLTVLAPQGGSGDSSTGDWPQWRGPERNGVSSDTGLLTKWPANGPHLLWESKGAGRGYASLAITGGRIYTLGDGPSTAEDHDEYLLCFDATDGKPVWKTRLGPAWNSGQPNWQSSRSTPTVDGDRVYVLTPRGELVCAAASTGKIRWRKSMQQDFGGKKGDGWGYSESVLIDGDHLICTPGGDKATMVALDKKTGRLIWKAVAPGNRGAGHSSAVLADVKGTRVYVQMTASGALGVRARDGKVLWSYPIPPTTAVIPTPIVRGDLVFIDAGYGKGGALLRQVPSSGGGVTAKEIYPLQRQLENKHGGVVLVGDYLYGDKSDSGRPWCADLMTGKVKWSKNGGSGSGSAAVAAADGHLYIRYADGTMVLAKASPEGYEEEGSFKIPHSGSRPSWSHPVITGGKLYLREGDHILCYDLRQE